jgi:DNA polymerase elongation subunit (family B)
MESKTDKFTRNLLVIDIETVSAVGSFDELDEKMQKHWIRKASWFKNDQDIGPADLYREKSAIYAEFGKVVCIAAGFFFEDEGDLSFRVRDFCSVDEHEVLSGFSELVENKFDPRTLRLAAHNGREFDFPYLCRRMLVCGIPIPQVLQISGKKPWEVNHIDTMELWKFGDYKHFTSLDLLASLFGIPSSKNDIDGSMVHDVYYREQKLDTIAEYCKRDVVVTAQVLLRLFGQQPLDPKNIFLV